MGANRLPCGSNISQFKRWVNKMKKNEVTLEEIEQRKQWLENYINQERVIGEAEGKLFACPCCGYLTLEERGGYDICPVCFWEDDGQDDHNADLVLGGPNGRLSLSEARKNFREFGASNRDCLKHVRQPLPEEMP